MSTCYWCVCFDRGSDPNDVDGQGLTPLHVACECGRTDNVHFLLKKADEGMIMNKNM